MKHIAMSRIIYLDESHFVIADQCRRSGHAIGGDIVENDTHVYSKRSYSLFCAISWTGVVYRKWLDVSEHGETGTAEVFVPFLRSLSRHSPEDAIIVLDNAAIHKTQDVQDLIDEIPQSVVFLPPYSPDYNPIELVFGWLKRELKNFAKYSSYLPRRADRLLLRRLPVSIIQSFYKKVHNLLHRKN
jgi:transposase